MALGKSGRWGCLVLGVLFSAAVAEVVYRNWGWNVGSLVVDQKPPEAVFVGRWQLQSTSLPSVTNRTGTTTVRAELTLKPGGRFTATDFPIEDGFTNPKWRLKSGEGYWEVYRSQYYVLGVGFEDGFSMPLDIRSKAGVVVALTHSVSDPDSNERWIWRRVSD